LKHVNVCVLQDLCAALDTALLLSLKSCQSNQVAPRCVGHTCMMYEDLNLHVPKICDTVHVFVPDVWRQEDAYFRERQRSTEGDLVS
jgi:hypothetical protein